MRFRKRAVSRILFACIISQIISGCGGFAGNIPADKDTAAEKTNVTSGSEQREEPGSGMNGLSAVYSEESQSASRDVFAMDTYMSITAYGEETTAKKAVDEAAEEVERLDKLLSTGSEGSEISKINGDGGGTLSEESEEMMRYALKLYQDTDGAYDITIHPVMKLWGFDDQDYRVPAEEELKKTLELVDASEIDLDEKNNRICFGKEGMAIDLGSIAKGFTSSRIMEIFEKNGIRSGLVNLGGNVQCFGAKTDGSSWRVAIETPEKDGNYLGVLAVKDKAVITSGGYERYFEEDGVIYHHIIDPLTGYPAKSGIRSSTIVSDDGTLADGLSTSLFVLGREKAVRLWRNHSDEFDFILMEDDGTLLVTEGIANDFETERKVEVITASAGE